MKAALYVRVSTLNQIERESLSNQEERLRAYCKANNIPEYKIYKDAGISAKDIRRPALEQLMEDIEQDKVNMVVVTKLDRITRSLKDLIELMEFFENHNTKFISITQSIDTTGPMGRFMLNLLGSVAQVEREMTAERVAEDMHHRALSGKWNGGPIPYGYTIRQRIIRELRSKGVSESKAVKEAGKKAPEAKRLYVDNKEAAIIKTIYKMYLEEKSLRGVTNRLNAEGYRTRKGMQWASASMLRVLTNPTYTGRIWYGKRKTTLSGKLQHVPKQDWKIVEGEHERIISDEVFYEVQDIIGERSFKKTRAKKTYMLSGLLTCGKCQGPMYGYTYRKKYKSRETGKTRITEYFWYKCNNNISKGSAVCEGMTVPGKNLEDSAIKTLMELSEDKQFLNDKKKLLQILEKKLKPGHSQDKELKKLVAEERNIEDRKQVLIEKLETRVIDNITFKKEFDRLKKLLLVNQDTQARIRGLAKNADLNRIALNASFEQLANFGHNWEFLDVSGKKARLRAVVKEIVVNDGTIDVKVFADAPSEVLSSSSSGSCPENSDFGGQETRRYGFVEEVSRRGTDSLKKPA